MPRRAVLCLALFAASCASPAGELPGGDAAVPVDAAAGAPDGGADAADATMASDAGSEASDAGTTDGGAPDARDPFAPVADTSEGLTNTSSDLMAILEGGALRSACDAYRADPGDRRKRLLCGKSMFFYEGFGTLGVPAVLFDFFGEHFPNEVGHAYSRLGLIPDPTTQEPRPLGAAPGAPIGNNIETVAFTCAFCHFGQLPDGRYSVGAPNLRYEYGRHILTIALAPALIAPGADTAAHHPAAVEAVRPIVERLQTERPLRLRLLVNLLPLLGTSAPGLTVEQEGWYASWAPGTMDFTMAPLPVDDEVHTISKIIDLWGIPSAEEEAAAGMPHALLAWTGGAPSLEAFLDGFVKIGGGPSEAWTPERLGPLADYIRSLEAPKNEAPLDGDLIFEGRRLFTTAGCKDCHGAPRGSGAQSYTFEEIGTDDRMRYWGDPQLTGRACCGLQDEGGSLTHGIKSPRLSGLWAKTRLLHNGSVESLEALLCLTPRAGIVEPAHGDGGHEFGCDRPAAERRALAEYLRSL